MWSALKDLNPRPPAPKAGALPDCAKRGKSAGLFPAVSPSLVLGQHPRLRVRPSIRGRQTMSVYSRLSTPLGDSSPMPKQSGNRTWGTGLIPAGLVARYLESGMRRPSLNRREEAGAPSGTFLPCVSFHAAPGTKWAGIRGAGPKRSRNFPALLGSWGPGATPTFRSPGLCRFSPIS